MTQVCTGDCSACFAQPDQSNLFQADGIGVMQWSFPDAGTVVPQHAHAYDHLTMLATGGVAVWVDGTKTGEFKAPTGITIKAGVSHTFKTLAPGTTFYCIHNVERTGRIEVLPPKGVL